MLNTTIDQCWPLSEMEAVSSCPYCGSKEKILAHKSVEDYFFGVVSGKWDYWSCGQCAALYLDPRPIRESIGKAYSRYYTHSSARQSVMLRLKVRLKNECLSHWLNVGFSPRIGLTRLLGFVLWPFKAFIRIPFDIQFLAKAKRGKLVDVGCGGGTTLNLARQIGWDVMGVEIDSLACKAANQIGLNVIQGDYSELRQFVNAFDCVLCSHALEHVYEPLEMLRFLTDALKKSGYLIISLPNARSDLGVRFGKYWRGLEAPRHISIPTLDKVESILQDLGYVEIRQYDLYEETYWQSLCTERKQMSSRQSSYFFFKMGRLIKGKRFTKHSDYIQIIAKKA